MLNSQIASNFGLTVPRCFAANMRWIIRPVPNSGTVEIQLSAPSRVGDLVNLSKISTLTGDHKVLQVMHTYVLEEPDSSKYFARVEILFDDKEASGLEWLTQS
ncbi:MAG TPA: hypothetical protein VF896_09770 [Anaerolineales bacterium]